MRPSHGGARLDSDTTPTGAEPAAGGDVFRIPGFFAFWSAETVSAFGSYVTTLAVHTTVVLLLGGTATDVGLVTMAGLLPNLLLGPVAGALVDRYQRLRVLIVTDVASGLLLCLLPLLWILGRLDIPVLMALMFATNVSAILNSAAAQSVLPRLVPRRHLLAANARIDQGATVAQTSGSLVAGGLIALLGAPLAILADAVSCFVSAAAVATVRLKESPQRPQGTLRTLHSEAGEALRWLYRHSLLGPLAISTHVWFFATGLVGTAMVAYALRAEALGPFWLGFVYAQPGWRASPAAYLPCRSAAGWARARPLSPAVRWPHSPGFRWRSCPTSRRGGWPSPSLPALRRCSGSASGWRTPARPASGSAPFPTRCRRASSPPAARPTAP